jgi:hypothetical protein
MHFLALWEALKVIFRQMSIMLMSCVSQFCISIWIRQNRMVLKIIRFLISENMMWNNYYVQKNENFSIPSKENN